jgi:hypothetical protein
MRSIYLPSIDATDQGRTALDRMLAIVRCHTVNLITAINRSRYEIAWLEGRELERALDLVEVSLGKVPETGRAEAMERVAVVRSVALRVLALAPRPSNEAIAQARSTDWWASRSAWESEQQIWIAACVARGPLLITNSPDELPQESASRT